MTKNYVCIHGHFYQPPRENPWLEEIEYQPSAFPYHDWNERVTRECYGPNTRARLEGDEGRILKLVNNYEYINFDFGPTLLSWIEKVHPWIYNEILAADRASRTRYQGHGNAMAQVYNHIIMPLASTRDKQTQIRWGLADFAYRFGHPAEGMWLAETAVDLETLALMAEEGIRYTVLAPTQAQAVRPLGDPNAQWEDVSGGLIDTTRPYRVFPRGKDFSPIDVFFFDKDLSKAVAYEKVLASGSAFLARLEKGVAAEKQEPCLVNVATDGESYGHHFKFGDMALAWIFDHLGQDGSLELTNYAWFLEQFPPQKEVRIVENSSWSCTHGIERWRADCGCNVNHREGWNQAWRAPLREAMDWLSGELSAIFEEQAGRLFRDPWAARDNYAFLLLDPSPESRDRFLERHVSKEQLDQAGRVMAFELMESQRMALYMYTSCGWFFDDISGLEATQVLMYADRAMNLVRKWAGPELEDRFVSIISRAKSNDPNFGDGAAVFERRVKRGRMSPERIAANYVFARMFCEKHGSDEFVEKHVRPMKEKEYNDGGSREASGEVLVSDPMTGNTTKIFFSASGHEPEDFECQVSGEGGAHGTYTFADLAPDTRRGLMRGIADSILDHISQHLREREDALLLCLEHPLEGTMERLPGGLEDVLRLLVRTRLLRLPEDPENVSHEMAIIREFIRNASAWDCPLRVDDPETRDRGRKLVNRLMDQIAESAEKMVMTALMEFLDLADAVSLNMDLWECQNYYWDLSMDGYFIGRLSPEQAKAFKTLGKRLGFIR